MGFEENLTVNSIKVYYNGITTHKDIDILLALSAFSPSLFYIKNKSTTKISKRVVKIYEIIIHQYHHNLVVGVVMQESEI